MADSASTPTPTPKRGIGRQGTVRAQAGRQGDKATFDALAPPSERKLTDAEKCLARTTTGNMCQNRRGSNTDHPGYGNCSRHGGNTEAGVKAAMKEMGRDLIEKYRSTIPFGGDRNDPSIANLTPESALLEEVRRSAAMVRFLEQRIAMWNLTPASHQLIEKMLTAPTTVRKDRDRNTLAMRDYVDQFLESLPQDDPDSPHYLPSLTDTNPVTGITSFTDAREWLYLYREERGHLSRVAKMAIDAGVAQRLVTLAEDQGRILASAIRAVLVALSLTPDQEALVPIIVPPILRAVANDQPIPDITSMLPPAS